jgi:hypothetical protein
MSKYDILFEPIQIGPVTAPNRFYQVPHASGMTEANPRVRAAFRGMKAEGGWGVVSTGAVSTHPSSDDSPLPYGRLWDDNDVRSHSMMVDAVHEHGALAAIELWHGGASVMNRASRFRDEGSHEPVIDFVKKVTDKPVVGVGRFTTADTMVSQLRRGILDLIGGARPGIADPFLPNKIREGRLDEIRECIGCNICISSWHDGVPVRCTQNATAGEEWRRGYKVSLADRREEFGGRLIFETSLPGLRAWGRVGDYRIQALQQMARAICGISRLQKTNLLKRIPSCDLSTTDYWLFFVGVNKRPNSFSDILPNIQCQILHRRTKALFVNTGRHAFLNPFTNRPVLPVNQIPKLDRIGRVKIWLCHFVGLKQKMACHAGFTRSIRL